MYLVIGLRRCDKARFLDAKLIHYPAVIKRRLRLYLSSGSRSGCNQSKVEETIVV